MIKEGYTNKEGVAEFELEFGKYFYQEFDAPDGYQIDDTLYEFYITEDGQMVSVVMTNQPEETPEEGTPENPDTPEDDNPEPTVPSQSTEGPKTGDNADMKLWITIAAGALVVALAGACIFYKAKKDDEDD